MPENLITQPGKDAEFPTPKQFRENFKEIFEAETTYGSVRAARDELLESVSDLIKEYLTKGSRIVYLHGKLKDAGYTGSRKELSEWLVEHGLWTKHENHKKTKGIEKNVDKLNAVSNTQEDNAVRSDDNNTLQTFDTVQKYSLNSIIENDSSENKFFSRDQNHKKNLDLHTNGSSQLNANNQGS